MIFPKGGVNAESTILFGKYQICRVIGSGRNSTVFLAKHLGLGEFRAVKRVPREEVGFFRETAVLRELKHPGIPIIYDLEEDPNFYYLIEEYLEGESLYALVQRQGSLTGTKIVSLGTELCQIMDYLHSFKPNPILYLDLQPHNILICKGTLKLIDFDQAIFFSQAERLRKRYGTPGCAAPEQYTDEPVDVRTDIYAIGALLHYMWKGSLPDPQAQDAGSKVRGVKIPGLGTEWEEGLRAITERCLSPNREERYTNTGEVIEDLIRLKQGVFNEKQVSLLRIAVVGSSHGMGATHVSLSVLSYLAERGITALYQENNDSRAVASMAAHLGKSPDLYGIYHIRDLALKPRYGPCVRLNQPEFDAVVEDCGTELQSVSQKEYDLLLLVCGGKWWELEHSVEAIRCLAQKDNLRVVFNHISSGTEIALPEDITKLIFYKMPGFPTSGGERFCRFLEEMAAETEGGRKIRELSKERTGVRGWGSAALRILRGFSRILSGAGRIRRL